MVKTRTIPQGAHPLEEDVQLLSFSQWIYVLLTGALIRSHTFFLSRWAATVAAFVARSSKWKKMRRKAKFVVGYSRVHE